MSADVAPTNMFEGDGLTNVKTTTKRRSGVFNVWNEQSLSLVMDESESIQKEVDGPLSSSVAICATDCEYEKERQHEAFLAAVELLNGVTGEDNHRKSSDSVIHHRISSEAKLKDSIKKRCLSDSNGTKIDMANLATFENNLLSRFDSGIADARPLELSSFEQTPLSSDGESSPTASKTTMAVSATTSSLIKRCGSLDDRIMRQLNIIEDDASSHHSAASSGSKNRRSRGFTKNLSQCSMGGSSTSFSSFYECVSNVSIATDILSGLGFDDFDNPELIPDRFIPVDIEYARPTLMKESAILVSGTPDVYSSTPIPPSLPHPPPPASVQYPLPTSMSTSESDLPLGATADNFLTSKPNRSQSPPPSSPPFDPNLIPPHRFIDPSMDRKYSVYALTNPGLETVPEETASDLSPSPRWLSPRVSLDHSVLDLSMPHLGTSLAAANRKRSLPNREGYRLSVDSMISEQDSTVYFSVTSYDDDIAKELEEAVPPPLPLEDVTIPRRRRRGVHGAPPELLSWLQNNPILEERDEPWPFNEQLRLRRSLTEIEQRRSRTSSSDTIGDRSLSPLPFHDPLAGIFPRRFSVNGPLLPPIYMSESRRLSLPSNSSFRSYNSPPPAAEEEENIPQTSNTLTRKSSDVPQRFSNKLPPGMTRDEALEYKRETIVLKSEVKDMQNKLHSSEKVVKKMEDDYRRKFSDTQEWLRSELWMKERHCKELEEIVESQRQELAQVQQNNQIKIARAKEEIRDVKEIEIKELHHKIKQRQQEFEEKLARLEEDCKHLRFKETQLLKKISQQGLKNENEELHREVTRLKEQVRKEKETVATVLKEKAMEVKQLRTKHQMDKEDALKQLKHHLQKLHDTEINSIKQQILKGSFAEASPSKSIATPSKIELKKLRHQIDRQEMELRGRQDEINNLQCQLKILHKEHLGLQRKLAMGIQGEP